MNTCPLCHGERVQTIVDCTHEAPRQGSDPKAVCQVPIYPTHNPREAVPCNQTAVLVDAFFPVYWQGNRCEAHRGWPEPDESFDPGI